MTKLKIKVTKEILKRSMYCGTPKMVGESIMENCAIALALGDIFPGVKVSDSIEIPVAKKYSSELFNFFCIKIDTPDDMMNFIDYFDSFEKTPLGRLRIEEQEFELEIPDEVLEKVIDIDDIKEILKNSSVLELVEV